MKINAMDSNNVILKEIGKRIKMKRISMSMTQRELAIEAGVSLRTINNMEIGMNVSFNNVISVLRVLRLLDNLELLIPEHKVNPLELLKLGRERKRVSNKSKKENETWKWGDEK